MKKIVYHGSSNKNLRFNNSNKPLMFFTTNKDDAKDWADRLILGNKKANTNSYVYTAEITFNKLYEEGSDFNPKYAKYRGDEDEEEIYLELFYEDILEKREELVKAGYDCFHTKMSDAIEYYIIPYECRKNIKWINKETLSDEQSNFINIKVNGKNVEILVLDEKDSVDILKDYMKEYKDLACFVFDKYYFWNADIEHDVISDKLNLKDNIENQFMIYNGIVDGGYINSFREFYDEDKEDTIKIARKYRENYKKLSKFDLYLSVEDAQILNNICNDTFEKLNERLEKFIDEEIFITNSAYDIANLLKNKPKEYRILYDKNIGYYFIGDADSITHWDMLQKAYKDAYYYNMEDFIDSLGAFDNYVEVGQDGGWGANDEEIEPYLWYIVFSPNEEWTLGTDGYNKRYDYSFGHVFTRSCDLDEISLWDALGVPQNTEKLNENTLKGYRYVLTCDGEYQGVGMFHGLSEVDRDEDYIEYLEDMFKELNIPQSVFNKNRVTTSYFTEKGLKKFKKAIEVLQQAYEDYSLYSIEMITDEINPDEIVYQDDYQIIVKGEKEVNLNETFNDAFWRWFRYSQVKDSNGNPLVCFHGSSKTIDNFDISYSGSNTGLNTDAIFFTSNKEAAKAYSAYAQEIETEEDYKKFKNVKLNPCYLNIENPYIYDAKGKELKSEQIYTLIWTVKKLNPNLVDKEEFDLDFYNEIKPTIKDIYDGIILKNVKDFPNYNLFNGVQDNYIVFKDTQIKPLSTLNEEKAYHGSNNLFKAFKKSYIGTSTAKEEEEFHKSAQHGFFFTSDKNYADNYGKYLYTCELTINNPLIVDMSEYMATDDVLNKFILQAKKCGNDGVIFQNIREVGRPLATEYFVFEPNQIKIENIYSILNEELMRYL